MISLSLKTLESFSLNLTRYMDLVLAFVVVAIISLMILPMPPAVVDGLIAASISISILILLLTIYIPSAVAFSVFPTLLLFITLYRLSLGVATTRLILIKAYAGDIILTFGNFVVAGNFVVGAVVFLIITIVQFLVVTKGAERVAEVAARFTLDAMPGKQMSIDADLRNGVIDMKEAKRRRSNLETESKLYGAMDGAMKFVKGDAIAGLIIVAVNILGGLAIGILQKGMSLEKAIKTYSILTIGDGLVTQIPALLVSITSGILVTRVTGDDENLGAQIGSQILSQPKALMVGSAIMLAFALVPGFPKIQFVLLGAAAGGIGYALYKTAGKPEAPGQDKTSDKPEDLFGLTAPIIIDVDPSLKSVIPADALDGAVAKVRQALYFDLGVPYPGIQLRFNDTLSDGAYVIYIDEVPMSQAKVLVSKVLVREKPDNLKILGIPFEEGKPLLPGMRCLWVDESLASDLKKAGVDSLDTPRVLALHLSTILKRNAPQFLGMQETTQLLDRMEGSFPVLVKELQRVLPVEKITNVLRRLVGEEISIRNLRTVLQTLVEWGQKEKDEVLLAEYVRGGLSRYISYKYTGGLNTLPVYLLDPTLEDLVRKAVRQSPLGSYLALEPAKTKVIIDAVRKEVGDITNVQQKPVLLTSMDIRRYIRKLIEMDFYDLAVLSYQELTPEVSVQPMGKISIT